MVQQTALPARIASPLPRLKRAGSHSLRRQEIAEPSARRRRIERGTPAPVEQANSCPIESEERLQRKSSFQVSSEIQSQLRRTEDKTTFLAFPHGRA